jgi:plasmid stabilization system protein ParE
MDYHVEISPEADQELEAAFLWIAADSPIRALKWIGTARERISSLTRFPHRCPLAPESDTFQIEIRQLIVRPYRVLYTVHHDVVRLLHIRHASRKSLGE